MKILMREIIAKSGRKYRLYTLPYGAHGFNVLIKIKFIFLGFIPIWKYLKDNGAHTRPPVRLEFNNYTLALQYISEMELLNDKFAAKENNIVEDEKKSLDQTVIDDVYERN